MLKLVPHRDKAIFYAGLTSVFLFICDCFYTIIISARGSFSRFQACQNDIWEQCARLTSTCQILPLPVFRESLPVRIVFYFNNSGVSFTSSGMISW